MESTRQEYLGNVLLSSHVYEREGSGCVAFLSTDTSVTATVLLEDKPQAGGKSTYSGQLITVLWPNRAGPRESSLQWLSFLRSPFADEMRREWKYRCIEYICWSLIQAPPHGSPNLMCESKPRFSICLLAKRQPLSTCIATYSDPVPPECLDKL